MGDRFHAPLVLSLAVRDQACIFPAQGRVSFDKTCVIMLLPVPESGTQRVEWYPAGAPYVVGFFPTYLSYLLP